MSVEMSWALDAKTFARVEISSPGPTGDACGCVCAGECGLPVQAVNRGKAKGQFKREPHFRHRAGDIGCEGPTPHDLAVEVMHERALEAIQDGLPVMAEYDCSCGVRHTDNVLTLNGNATDAKKETLLREHWPTKHLTRPDVILVAKETGGVATIEVKHTHLSTQALEEGHPVLVIPVSTEEEARALGSGVVCAGKLYNHPCPIQPVVDVLLAAPSRGDKRCGVWPDCLNSATATGYAYGVFGPGLVKAKCGCIVKAKTGMVMRCG